MQTSPVVLVDSMIVIEAVRTGTWNAIAGQRQLLTVDTCAEELRRGDQTLSKYVRVTDANLARAKVEHVTPDAGARFRLTYPNADGLDRGERDLIALATTRTDDFLFCSCDKAAVIAAHALGWIDRVVSLEALANSVGARPNPPLRVQFTELRMSQWRTALHLGRTI